MNLLDSKHGQFKNWALVLVILFVSGFMLILCYYIVNEMIDGFTDAGLYTGEMVSAGQGFLFAFRLMDYLMVLLMVGLVIGVGVTSFKLATAKVFYIITFLFAAFFGYIGYYFSYIFGQIVSQDVFNAVLVFFPRSVLIGTNLHWVMLLVIIVGSITLYAKREKGQFVE